MKLQDFDFRVYDGNKKSYLTEDKLESVGLGIEKCNHIGAFLHFHDDSSIDYYIDNIEIELFTGFKDSNGKKIYEGDIVKIDKFDFIGVIEFSLGIGSCVRHCSKSTSLGALQPYIEKIIGNIHENPELLGGEE